MGEGESPEGDRGGRGGSRGDGPLVMNGTTASEVEKGGVGKVREEERRWVEHSGPHHDPSIWLCIVRLSLVYIFILIYWPEAPSGR